MTPSFPPYLRNLDSMSPIVLDTESLPGSTLDGPKIILDLIFSFWLVMDDTSFEIGV